MATPTSVLPKITSESWTLRLPTSQHVEELLDYAHSKGVGISGRSRANRAKGYLTIEFCRCAHCTGLVVIERPSADAIISPDDFRAMCDAYAATE